MKGFDRDGGVPDPVEKDVDGAYLREDETTRSAIVMKGNMVTSRNGKSGLRVAR